MALIDIEYGSLASSETMNKNFMYLDDKIAETSESIMTSVSSILSNIATINTRLNEMSNGVNDSVNTLNSVIEEYKNKTKLLIKKTSLLPDWKNCVTISIAIGEIFTVTSNGYILALPLSSAKGNLIINGTTVVLKNRASNYDNASQLMLIPVVEGDSIESDVSMSNIYFLPSLDVSIENF